MLWWKAKSYAQRLLIIVGLAVLLLVFFGFSRQIAQYSQLNSQMEREAAALTQLVSTQNYLENQIAYATSEAAVEEWAREQARWAQEGDFPIIPLPPANFTPEAPAEDGATASSASNWDAWLNWLFSGAP